MVIVAALSALSLLLSAVDPAQDLPAPQQDQPPPVLNPPAPDQDHPAATAYFDCLVAAARQLDDGHSDAATIALGIESNCADQFEALKQDSTADMNPDARALALEKLDRMQEGYAIKAVLTVRSLRARARSSN